MSIPALVQVYEEARRLAIAGSPVAPGDFRLKKLIPPLQQAGEKAPVFAKVAQSVQAVVDSNEKTASTALLDLVTLVNAILYTQGETGLPGDVLPLETTHLGGEATQASARVLKPLLEALASTGSGRLELIRDAVDQGTFKDLRLVKPALSALDDPYPDIADLIVEKVLPLYGKAILPELRAKLDLKSSKTGHQHRLRLMHALDPEGTRDVVKTALAEGSKEIRVVAVECLGTGEDDLPHLFEHAKSKARDVRAAALRALAASRNAAAGILDTLKKAIAGPDIELIVGRVRETPSPELRHFVLDQAQQQFAELLKLKDDKLQGPAISRLRYLVGCLEGRTDAPAEQFLLSLFDHQKTLAAIKSEPSGTDLHEFVAQVLARGTLAMQRKLVASHPTLTAGAFASAAYAARALLTPADFYEQFSPLLKGLAAKRGKKGVDAERGELLSHVLLNGHTRYPYRHWVGIHSYPQEADPQLQELDPRWLDAAIAAGEPNLVCRLARPGHAGVLHYLSDQHAKNAKTPETGEILATMIRIGHPGAADALIDELKRHAASSSYHYLGYWYGRLIARLPKSTFSRFEALLSTLPEKMADQLMDSVMALKNKPD